MSDDPRPAVPDPSGVHPSLPRLPALRVYEPLEAFPAATRERWRLVAAGQPSSRAAIAVDARRRALVGLLATPPVLVPPRESVTARVMRRGGTDGGGEQAEQVLVSPDEERLRSWEALSGLRGAYPARLLDAFVPSMVIEEAQREHQAWLERYPDVRPHARTGGWRVPLAWFAIVADEERVLTSGRPRSLTYVTEMSAARRRVARALRTLRRSAELAAEEDTEEVARWLEEFHPRSCVELDYGDIARLLPVETLEADHSARDVAVALAALAAGDERQARAAYDVLSARWREIASLERAN